MPAHHSLLKLLLALLLVLLAVFASGCIRVELFGSRSGPLMETRVFGERGAKILMIDLDGIIQQESSSSLLSFSESTVARVREELDRAALEGDIRAILLRIDTPGGSATASDVIYGELLRFKQKHGLPIVAHFMGTATSGGYYVAMAADEIVAEPTNVTGSIGVILIGVEVSGLMEKFGVVDQTITGGEMKDAGSPLRAMSEEERAVFQSVIDDLHERFRTVVAAGRPNLSREQIVSLSDGRIYSASQARDRGLVDSLGSIEETVRKIEQRLGVTESIVVSYHRRGQPRRNLYTRGPIPEPATREALAEPPAYAGIFGRLLPGFHYLWWPGLPR